MRLTDPWFEAEFIGEVKESGAFRRLGASIEGAQGVLLFSPCGYGQESGVHAVLVPFANPRNAPPLPASFEPKPRWRMEGTGLNDLTLSPSIDCTAGSPECQPGRRCWHGWIQNGDVT